jgi:hypothetical protein
VNVSLFLSGVKSLSLWTFDTSFSCSYVYLVLEGLFAYFHGSGFLLFRFRGFDKDVFVGVGEFVGLLALENP